MEPEKKDLTDDPRAPELDNPLFQIDMFPETTGVKIKPFVSDCQS